MVLQLKREARGMTSQFFAMIGGVCLGCVLWAIDIAAPWPVPTVFGILATYCIWSSVHFAGRKVP